VKLAFSALFLFFFSLPGLAAGYHCTGENLEVLLSHDESTLTVNDASGSRSYPVTEVVSRTGHSDQTYLTAAGVSFSIDDEFGDSILLNDRELPLICKSLYKPAT
jgi:hypothetical protein